MIRRSYGVWIDRRATRPARHSASRGPSSYVGVSRVFACTALRVTGSCMSSWPQRADPVQQRYSAWIDERVCQRIACPCLHGPGCQGSRISKRAQRADLAWQRYSVWIDGRAVPSGRKGQCRPRHPICLTYRVPLFCISQRTGRTTPNGGSTQAWSSDGVPFGSTDEQCRPRARTARIAVHLVRLVCRVSWIAQPAFEVATHQ